MEKKKGKKVAIMTENGFEQSELLSPKKALEDAGVQVHIISSKDGSVKAWNKTNWGAEVPVDVVIDRARVNDYDALVLPGGVMNPDTLRQNADAVEFARKFMESGKPVAAICHGPQTLIETGMLNGRTMTSFPSLKTDLKNAGVRWLDEEVVHDRNLITSRRPADLDAFNKELLSALG